MLVNSVPFIKYFGTQTVSSPGTAYLVWRADPAFGEGRRAGALFFARHRDYFIVTRNFTAIYRDWCRLDNFIVTRNLLPSIGTGKKQVTATLLRQLADLGRLRRQLIKPPGRYSQCERNQPDKLHRDHNVYTATAYLAHLLLRKTKPNTHAKAKEPNPLAPLLLICLST
jgi:hypothetical protein